jgi:hypothetical protein
MSVFNRVTTQLHQIPNPQHFVVAFVVVEGTAPMTAPSHLIIEVLLLLLGLGQLLPE